MAVSLYGNNSIIPALFAAKAVGFTLGKVIRFKQGILSPGVYVNNRLLSSHPHAWSIVIDTMCAQVRTLGADFDIIASVATGGIVHGAAIAREIKVPHVIVKKEEKTTHGVAGLIDGDVSILTGARVLLIEDMSSTFESSLRAMAPLVALGAEVVCTVVINTWGFPEFYTNVGDHSVYAGCTGKELVDAALERGMIDISYAVLLLNWLENPHELSWMEDEMWQLPAD